MHATPQSTPRPTTLDDLAAFNAELAALVEARIPLEPELRRLARQLPRSGGALAERIAGRLEQGSDLAEAIEAEGNSLPEAYRAIVVAGLASGDLSAALRLMAESARRLADIRRTAAVSLIYPVSVVMLASLLLAVVLWGVFTDIAWISPGRLEPVEQFARSPAVYWTLMVVVPITMLLAVGLWWWRSRKAGNLASGRLGSLGWIPGTGRLSRLTSAATLAEMLQLATAAQMPLDRGLELAGKATGDRRYRRAALALASIGRDGGDLSAVDTEPVKRHAADLPPLVRIALRQADHHRLFQSTLAQAAHSYQTRAESAAETISQWLPGLLTLSIAGTVTAVYAIGLMWPYTTMLQTMADAFWR